VRQCTTRQTSRRQRTADAEGFRQTRCGTCEGYGEVAVAMIDEGRQVGETQDRLYVRSMGVSFTR